MRTDQQFREKCCQALNWHYTMASGTMPSEHQDVVDLAWITGFINGRFGADELRHMFHSFERCAFHEQRKTPYPEQVTRYDIVKLDKKQPEFPCHCGRTFDTKQGLSTHQTWHVKFEAGTLR